METESKADLSPDEEEKIRQEFRDYHARFGRSKSLADAESETYITEYRAHLQSGVEQFFRPSRTDMQFMRYPNFHSHRLVYPVDIAEAREHLDTCGPEKTYMLRMIQWFIAFAEHGESIESEVLLAISEGFLLVLSGWTWERAFPLPWTEKPLVSKSERDFKIYWEIWEATAYDGMKPTKAIKIAAEKHHVSFETARAVYRRSAIKKRLAQIKHPKYAAIKKQLQQEKSR